MNFDGGVMDVVFVGHEMAHVLSNYIAGQQQGVFTHDAPLIVQESFSHFGEALLEQEMLDRAEGPAEKARVQMVFLAKEFDALPTIEHAEQDTSEDKKPDDPKLGADASDFPVVGHFTGVLAQKYSRQPKADFSKVPDQWADRMGENLTIPSAVVR